ncbi:MAG: NAD-binding protein [Chloroflexi bacterium]|nr:NAD-binding protein [Chloroflexota bacterium]
MEQWKAGADPQQWSEHFLVCGWHKNVPSIVRQLVAMSSHQVPVALINDLPAETMVGLLDQLRQELAHSGDSSGSTVVPPLVHIAGSPADDRKLAAAGAARARAAIIVADEAGGPLSGADDRAFRYTIALREVNSEATIVAEVQKPDRVQYLRNAGANEIEIRDTRLPFYLVAATRSPGLGTAARQLFGSGSPQAVRKAPVPSALWGRTLAETRQYFRRERGELVLGIISDPEQLSVDQVLSSGSDWVRGFIDRMLAESGQDVLAEARGTRQVRINPPDNYAIGPRDSAIVVPTGKYGGSASVPAGPTAS